jgi:hypothetical protein
MFSAARSRSGLLDLAFLQWSLSVRKFSWPDTSDCCEATQLAIDVGLVIDCQTLLERVES